jgi:hypothetical protein
MKRTVIIAASIVGAGTPLLAGMIFFFGCCALPFRDVRPKVMPMCHMSVDAMRGEHGAQRAAMPAREKQEPAKRIASETAGNVSLEVPPLVAATSASARESYRSFITLGAMRCDRDVGLHLLDSTFLI